MNSTNRNPKYHAGKHGRPLCGTRGTGDRWNVLVLAAPDWNRAAPETRCTKCAEVIRANRGA